MHLTGDPAGTVATRSAGLLEFSATFSYRSAEGMPRGPLLPVLPDDKARCSVVETEDPGEARREILGEIRGLTEADLGSALEVVLRSLTTAATVSEAVLHTRTTRVTQPKITPAAALQALALDLRDAGFPVRFGPTWTPVADGGLCLGVSGAEERLGSFLRTHPSWSLP